jgi:hypothetical protein
LTQRFPYWYRALLGFESTIKPTLAKALIEQLHHLNGIIPD